MSSFFPPPEMAMMLSRSHTAAMESVDLCSESQICPAKSDSSPIGEYFLKMTSPSLLVKISSGSPSRMRMLPSPADVVRAFIGDFPALCANSVITLQEALYGLALGVMIGFAFAVLMDSFQWLYRAFYPILVITQTIPAVAIAPLLVLWFGYEMTPKIILIVIVTFFPVTVGMLDGFRAVDQDYINLLRSMTSGSPITNTASITYLR